MPEGDTVFHTARRLTDGLAGILLVQGELRHPRLSTVDLAGRTMVATRSVGKHLFLRFDRDLSLHCHLGMDGSWRVRPAGGRTRHAANHQARAILATKEQVAIGRNLKQLALLPTADEHRLVDHLGPDLLDQDWSAKHAAEAAERLRREPDREIGVALLDQCVMAGIGNVFKTEVCFLLGVSPWTPTSEVDVARAVDLSRELLLRNALRIDRSTTGDHRRDHRLWVYGRARTGCLRCGGRVQVAAQGIEPRDRIAYFCPTCQPGPHP